MNIEKHIFFKQRVQQKNITYLPDVPVSELDITVEGHAANLMAEIISSFASYHQDPMSCTSCIKTEHSVVY